MDEVEAREWRKHPLYKSAELFRAKENSDGEFEVLAESGVVLTLTAEKFHEHFNRAAQSQHPIIINKKVAWYEYRTA